MKSPCRHRVTHSSGKPSGAARRTLLRGLGATWLGATLLGLCAAPPIGCGPQTDVVFIPLSVEFARDTSSAPESEESSTIALVLSAPAPEALTVTLRVTDDGASGHDTCGARDYSVPERSVRFATGQRSASIELRHLDDDLPEADERFRLSIEPQDAVDLGDVTSHTHTVVDDDRSLLADVQADFGAAGDGVSDDTEAIQQAIDRAANNDDAVVFFPPGRYVAQTLQLAAGLRFVGRDAIITRAANQPADMQTAVLDYSSSEDSALTIVQGLSFDGNRDAQAGGFDEWQYRNADLLAVGGGTDAGRLQLAIEDVTFRNTGASGIKIGSNTNASMCLVRGTDVFTDLVQFGGGNSRLEIRSLVADGETGTTGLALRSATPGYEGSLRVELELDDIELRTGDLHISVTEGSVVTGTNLRVLAAPLFVRAVRSSVTLSDSEFHVGPALYEFNRIVAPGNVRFEDSRFVITETPERTISLDEGDREIRALDVLWNDAQVALEPGGTDRVDEVLDDQLLVCARCAFELADDVEPTDEVYVVGTTLPLGGEATADEGDNNRIQITDAQLGDGIVSRFAAQCAGCADDE